MEINYICDRKACTTCKKSCKHTHDITHAKNFGRNDKAAWESDEKCRTELHKMKTLLRPIYENSQKVIKESSEYRKKINKMIADGKEDKEILLVALELIELLTGDTTIRSFYGNKETTYRRKKES